jgi:hypothetical protein
MITLVVPGFTMDTSDFLWPGSVNGHHLDVQMYR